MQEHQYISDPMDFCRYCKGSGIQSFESPTGRNITETCDYCGGTGNRCVRLTSPSVSSDPKALPATTHSSHGSEPDAQPVAGCSVTKVGRVSESAPRTPHIGGHPQEFRTVFADANDDLIFDDWHRPVDQFLTASYRILTAFVIAGIGTLIWVNVLA